MLFPLGLLWDSLPLWPCLESGEQRDQLAMKISAFVPPLLLMSALLPVLPRVGCTHLVVFKPAIHVKLLYCKSRDFPGGVHPLGSNVCNYSVLWGSRLEKSGKHLKLY